MNCLVFSDTFPNRLQPSRGPYNAQQIRELARLCEKVAVINPIPWPLLVRNPGLRDLVRNGSDGVVPGVGILHPVHWYPPIIGRPLYGRTITACIRRAMRRLSGTPWHVILSTWAFPHGHAAMLLARERGIPYAIKVRGTDINVLDSDLPRKRRTSPVLKNADAVIAVSHALMEKVIALGARPERTYLLQNGVDTERFRPMRQDEARKQLGLEAESRWIGMVGNLLPVKGPDILLQALARMPKPTPHLALVGEGEMRAELDALAQKLGLDQHVHFVGARPHDEVKLWINAIDILCLPSRNEGCPNVVLESLACGRPVVAARVGAVQDLLSDFSGIIVPSEDPQALSESLNKAMACDWERERIRASVLERDWKSNARQLHGILARTCEERHD